MRQTAYSVACTALLLAPGPAAADPSPSELSRTLFFSGVDVSSISSFSWAGADVALSGRDLSGPVLRLMGGAGAYDYQADHVDGGEVHAGVVLGEALAGWRHIGPGLAAAAFAGAEIEDHRLDREDSENRVSGTELGARLAAEVNWQPGERTRLEASAAYGTAFEFHRVRVAAGVAIWRGMYAGAEAESFGNIESDQHRLGLTLDGVRAGRFGFKASAGALRDGDGEVGAYGRLGMDVRW